MTSSMHGQLSSAASCSGALLTHNVCSQLLVTEDGFHAPTHCGLWCPQCLVAEPLANKAETPPPSPLPLPQERGRLSELSICGITTVG